MRKVVIAEVSGYYDADYAPGAIGRERDARNKVRILGEEAIKNIPFLAKKLKGDLKIIPANKSNFEESSKFIIDNCKISKKYKIRITCFKSCEITFSPIPQVTIADKKAIINTWNKIVGKEELFNLNFHIYSGDTLGIDIGYLSSYTDNAYKKRTKAILEVIRYLESL
jgi:hypothetical protein